jgi:hypothetical protein
MYRGVEGFLGVCIVLNYVHIISGDFPHVSGVCSIFLLADDQVKEDEMGMVCSTNGGDEECI